MVPETEAVNVKNRSHRVTVDLELQSGDEGALVSQGTRFGGWTLFVQDGPLHHVHNFMGRAEYHLESDAPLPTGTPCTATFEFTRTGEHAGNGRLLVDGAVVAEGPIPHTVPRRFGVGSGSLRVGDDAGISVSERYEPPFAFSGTLHRATIEVDGDEDRDPEADARIAIQSQ
jgi:arylsulfatase